ncbi:hypothetical protein TNCV_3357731 [Trichonephila clavipes]|nr:hypothetical protein TNCV_3357731 [Trichonephila clavipes]
MDVEIGDAAIYRPFGNFAELNRTVTCMLLKAKANDRRTSSPCHDEFRASRSDYVRQVALETTTTLSVASRGKEGMKRPSFQTAQIKRKGLVVDSVDSAMLSSARTVALMCAMGPRIPRL